MKHLFSINHDLSYLWSFVNFNGTFDNQTLVFVLYSDLLLQGSSVDVTGSPSWTAGCRNNRASSEGTDSDIHHDHSTRTERSELSNKDWPVGEQRTCKEEMGWSMSPAMGGGMSADSISVQIKAAHESRDYSLAPQLSEAEATNSKEQELQLAENGCPMELEHVLKVEIDGSDYTCMPESDTENDLHLRLEMKTKGYDKDISVTAKDNCANDVPFIKQEETSEDDWY